MKKSKSNKALLSELLNKSLTVVPCDIDGEIYTYQNFLKEYNTQLLLIGEWTSVGFGGSLIKEAMIRMCSEYKNGERYECKLHSVKDGANDFCSEKCKTEYSFSH